MKGFVKMIIAGAIIIGVGIAVLLIALGLNGWSFVPNFEMQEFTSTEVNSSVSVHLSTGRLKIEYTDEEYIQITYPTARGYETTVNENDGKLTLESNKHKWYIFTWGATIPETIVKIPRDKINEVLITMNAGTVDMCDGEFKTVKIKVNAGTCNVGNVTCLELMDIDVNAGTVNVSKASGNKIICDVSAGAANLKQIDCGTTEVKVSAGTANLSFLGEKSDYAATVDVSAGSCNGLTTQSGGDKNITVRVSAGSCNVSFGS